MAEHLVILVALASVIGVFFLVLFRVLARQERRAFRKLKGAHPSTREVAALRVPWRVAGMVPVLVGILALISFRLWRNR
jgi:hypothetical protein